MRTRWIGGREVSAIGLGVADLALRPGLGDRAEATIHAALDEGVTLIDTADAYAPTPTEFGYGEHIVRRALSTYGGDTSHVLVATKFGHVRDRGRDWALDGSPDYVRRAADASLAALGVDTIGLYQYHRPDPDVPYADTMGALAELRKDGKVAMVGISNANIEQIMIAQEVLGDGLACVQNEFSFRFRSSEDELRHCERDGIAFLPWAPLGGAANAGRIDANGLGRIARAHGVSPHRVCLAWMLHLAPNVVPIPGCTRPETIRDSAAAAALDLTEDDVRELAC